MALKLAFLLLENKTNLVFTGRSQGAERHVVFVLSLSPAFLYFFCIYFFYTFISIYIFQVVILICLVKSSTGASPSSLISQTFIPLGEV